jgi:hypothetical protein
LDGALPCLRYPREDCAGLSGPGMEPEPETGPSSSDEDLPAEVSDKNCQLGKGDPSDEDLPAEVSDKNCQLGKGDPSDEATVADEDEEMSPNLRDIAEWPQHAAARTACVMYRPKDTGKLHLNADIHAIEELMEAFNNGHALEHNRDPVLVNSKKELLDDFRARLYELFAGKPPKTFFLYWTGRACPHRGEHPVVAVSLGQN